jgi:hypothetical protein
MVSFPSQMAPLANAVPAWALLLSMLVVSLILLFAGRKVVKFLAFLVFGLIGASIGGILVAQLLAGAGSLGTIIGLLLGFILGGFIGVMLLALGIGIVIGYAAYVLTASLVSGTAVPLIVGFLFFIVGLALHNKILSFVTAVAGGILLFDVLEIYGLGSILSAVIAVVATLAGIWVQESQRKRMVAPPAPPPPAQPTKQS